MNQTPFQWRRLVLCALVLCAVAARGDQAQETSTKQLIEFVTYQSGRSQLNLILVSCASGPTTEDRDATRELVRRGASALMDIEAALADLEKLGRESKFAINARWLLYALAAIRGSDAVPRIRRLLHNPAVEPGSVGAAVSLALGITSYVPAVLEIPKVRRIHCDVREPRDALDDLVLGWLQGDRTFLEEALGPRGRRGLRRAFEKRGLAGLSWRRPAADLKLVAVGYRLEVRGRWGEPIETLERDRVASSLPARRFTVGAEFTDRLGRSCGRAQVSFVNVQTDDGGALITPDGRTFQVDNDQLGDLLHLVQSCATAGANQP